MAALRLPRTLAVVVALLVCVGLVYAVKICPKCGTENSDNAQFCKNCGAKLGPPVEVRPATPRIAGHVTVSGTTVTITSDPSGAVVVVDGQPRGRTPLELKDVAPGSHSVNLSRDGNRDYNGEFTVTVSTGSVVVTTDPVGADVLLDGQAKGRALQGGLVLSDIVYGTHTVTARLAGYQDGAKSVELASAGPVGVTIRLALRKGFLRVSSEPGGAQLVLNGTPTGTTPYEGEVLPGRYVVTLSRHGYYDWVGYAEAQAAETVQVSAALEKAKTRKLPLLVAGIAGIAGGAGAAFLGESQYARYRSAANAQDALKYRSATETWDLVRDGALAAGGLFSVGFVVLRW